MIMIVNKEMICLSKYLNYFLSYFHFYDDDDSHLQRYILRKQKLNLVKI